METDDYLSQLTEAERSNEALQAMARDIIESREPELSIWYGPRSCPFGMRVEIESERQALSRIYFPSVTSRDAAYARARRVAMEYSLWSQLYPGGYDSGHSHRVHVIDAKRNVVSSGWSRADDLFNGGSFLLYDTARDAQRVLDILLREKA